MIIRKLILGFVLALSLSNCSGLATGGSSTVVGNPESPGSDSPGADSPGSSPVNTGTEGSLFGAGPVDIPAPIAKLQSPNPAYITVSIGSTQNISALKTLNAGEQVCITGNAGAIPDPVTTPFVYIYDSVSATAQVETVAPDGSWIQTCFDSEGPFAVASSVDALASQISAPIFLKIDENTYLWLLTNGDTISSGAVTFVDNTVYLVSTSSVSANVSAPQNLIKTTTTTTSSVYSLGIAGTYDEVGTCACTIKELLIANGKTVARDSLDDIYLLNDTTFEKIFELDGTETYDFMRIDDDEDLLTDNENLPPGYTAAHVYLSVITDTHIYMVDLDELDNDVVYDLAADEQVVSWGWGRGVSVVLNLLNQTTQAYTQISLNSAHTTYNPDWSTIWDSRTTGGTQSGNHFYRIVQSDSTFLSTGQNNIAVGQTMGYASIPTGATEIINDTIPDCSGISGEPVTFFTTWNNRSTGCGVICYLEGNPETTFQFCDSDNDDIGDTYEILSIDSTHRIYEIWPHPSMEFDYYCALDDAGLGQIYAYFPDDDDVIPLTDGVEHCNRDNNWRIDPDTGYLVFTNAASDLESTQVDFLDAYTDPRLLGTD